MRDLPRQQARIDATRPCKVRYEAMRAAHRVIADLDGSVVERMRNPSSNTPTHLSPYGAFPQI
ncbi:MAG: class II aldolase/adducin family protein [Bryobacterales bacterium]|nr:class II aldolase/adducin family protein [Bryobacterales bacterium]